MITMRAFETETTMLAPFVPEIPKQDSDGRAAGSQCGDMQWQRHGCDSYRREADKQDVDGKDPPNNLIGAHAAIRGALVIVASMSLYDRFAVHSSLDQRDGGICEVVKRQQ